MPFNTDRLLFHGRPRPSLRRFGLGINRLDALMNQLHDHSYRRKVRYYDTETAEIRSLLFSLSFTRDRDHWSSSFRRGWFEVSSDDFAVFAKAMGLRAKEFHHLAQTAIS
jgi:hypothetical protein